MNLKKPSVFSDKITAAISNKLKKSPIKEGLDLSSLAEELTQRKLTSESEEE